jgi:DUF1680 family protein
VKGTIKLRIPGWARNQPVPGTLYAYANKVDKHTTVSINGNGVSAVPDETGYVSLTREWGNGYVVEVEFPVEVRKVAADQRVAQDRRRLAVERGPIVYCAEWPDAEDGRVLDLLIDAASELKPSSDAGFYGGSPSSRHTLGGSATRRRRPDRSSSYRITSGPTVEQGR